MVKKHQHARKIRGKREHIPPYNILTPLIIIIILCAAYFILMPGGEQTRNATELVLVNGEPIYLSELDKQWKSLPVQAKQNISRDQLLEQLVQERLLLQEADKQNITIADEQVQQYINAQLAQSGATKEQFEQALQQQGTSLEEVAQTYRRQLIIAKLFEETVSEEPLATQEDILAYYQDNKEQFFRQQRVTVRHILIQTNESEKPEIVDTIEKQLDAKNNSNFCDLVNNYTMDIGSRNNCGEYTFARGQMVPAFEEASFEMNVGERRTVNSSFGYHIIIKDDDLSASYAGLNTTLESYSGQPTVQQVIESTILQEKARSIFDTYVTQLTNESTITYVAE